MPALRWLLLFEQTGIDAAVVLPFDEHQAQESPLGFVERVLFKCLRTECVVVGDDFHFGRHREGNVALLREYGTTYGFEVEPVHLLTRPDGIDEPLSSTAIRRALAGGEVELAAKLLGRPFEARGVVGLEKWRVRQGNGDELAVLLNLRRPARRARAAHR